MRHKPAPSGTPEQHVSMMFGSEPANKMSRSSFMYRDRTMKAVVTTGHGGYETLEFREVPIPDLASGEALLKVLAAGVNNTEINTRIGWYSSSVTVGTEKMAATEQQNVPTKANSGWNEATPFPLIQGTDCCGQVVAVADVSHEHIIGSRVLVRPCMRPSGFKSWDNLWLGSDLDGAFAQFVKVPVSEIFTVQCNWTDAELGTIPCAYGTAENMLHRANVVKGDHVLVAGASGGVGSAAVQLAKRRGAIVTAIASEKKKAGVQAIGADHVIDRGDDPAAAIGENSFDAIVDTVAGSAFGSMLKLLRRGGRFVSSGAIGGPLVTLDIRTLYLRKFDSDWLYSMGRVGVSEPCHIY